MIKTVIDMAGLDAAIRDAKPGVSMTCAQIAHYGKCSERNIRKIETRALRHLREMHPDLFSLIEQELYA